MGHSRGSSDEFERGTAHRNALAARTVPELGENEVTKGKLPLETGLLPRKYVACVLDAADGRLLQQAVVARTGRSEPYVSRLPERIEERDAVVRVQFGRGNVVYLPEAVHDTEVNADGQSSARRPDDRS